MSINAISATFIQHDSEPTHYVHPYLFTHESDETGEVYVWSSNDNSLYATLEEPMADPKAHHLLPNDYLLSLTTATENHALSEILIHKIPDGVLVDRMTLGPLDSSGSDGNSKFLCVNQGNIAVWRNKGASDGSGFVEIYTLSTEGKLVLSETLLPPQGCPSFESDALPGKYFPPSALVTTNNEIITVNATKRSFPSCIDVIRFTSNTNTARQKHITFDFLTEELPSPNADMQSSLSGHVYLPTHNAVILAHNEFPFESSGTNPVTAIRCLDVDTLELRWSTSLPCDTCKLRYISEFDVVLSLGNAITSLKDEDGTLLGAKSHLSIIALDPATGDIRASHILGGPERPCGNVHWEEMAGVCCDVTPKGDSITVIHGDGQLAVIPVKELLGLAPVEFLNNDKLKTVAAPDIEPSIPSTDEERKDVEDGRWRWVRKGFVGDNAVLVHLLRNRGFVGLTWE
ncbi:hypothetical protein JR316_0006554 [Psilocybe cubensis]|uniref:Uncharacterized protein n=2 Tax=Psilocybe cubensis TaxID=181762 RepID=A0A8H8CDV9_PSICU|nr:hypothetical protein JR316_0006554 [Psilocybe cubensis]KAH9482024.1 hypothetical protein JR316_0006554 [Psilocybe cubensis]